MPESAHMKRTALCDRCKSSVQHPYFPTSPKVRSDYVPADDELKELSSSIKDLEVTLGHYEIEIGRIQEVLEKLEAGRAQLKQQIREQKAIISPLRRIPIEIYHKIFSHACYADEDASEWDYTLRIGQGPHTHVAPAFQISLISSHWRRIAVDYPPIWSSISVHLLALAQAKVSTKALVRMYLKNAGTNALKIYIFSSDDWTEEFTSTLSRQRDGAFDAFRLLLAHMERCWHLHLDITAHALSENLVGVPNLKFSALRYFHNGVRVTGDVDAASTSWFWRAIGQAPLLDQLFALFALPPRLDAVPYERLSSMDIFNIGEHRRFLRLIRRARNLRHLMFVWDPPDVFAITTSYELTSLEELEICFSCPPENCFTLMDSFRTPNLTDLTISGGPFGVEIPYNIPYSFIQTLSRLSSTLRRLHIDITTICPTDDSTSNIISILPNLEYFGARWSSDKPQQDRVSPWLSHLLKTLTLSSKSPSTVVVPNLRMLVLHESHSRITSGAVDQLLTMVESRSSSRLADTGQSSKIAALYKVGFSYWTNRGSILQSFLPVDQLLTDGHRQRLRLLEEDGTLCLLEEAWHPKFSVSKR